MTSDPERAERVAIEDGEAHVWRVELREPPPAFAGLLACLSPAERARLERQRTPAAQLRFAVTRVAMRHILARYTGRGAATVEVVVDANGKPALAADRTLHFSLTHADRLALLGIARVEIGIDVERVRRPRRLLATARRVLHADTVVSLERLSGERQLLAFLDAWTQREAHVKAVGGGLFITPDALPFRPEQSADGEPRHGQDRTGGAWSVVRFVPADDARASLVARGHITRVRYFDWNTETVREGEDE